MQLQTAVDVASAIRGRRATRAYTGQSVDRRAIERLIDAAVRAPSAMNLQPWAFVVFEGAERLLAMSGAVKRVLPAGSLAQGQPNVFHGAPALVLICATSHDSQAAEDCALAAENFMLAAYAEGLATCPVGFARVWFSSPQTKQALGIPEDLVPVLPLALGHPAETPPDRGRREPRVIWR